MFKKLFIGITFALLFLLIGPNNSFAQTYVNPSYQEINKLLTEAALQYNIPPEIVKALAFQESGWKQFENGAPTLSLNGDGGIGIMQVTNDPRFDQERLKTDIQYNIHAGIQKLDGKYRGVDGLLPILNNNERDILENWYFAVLAYNGKVPKNSPIYKDDGSRNDGSYQNIVFDKLNKYNNQMGIYPIPFDFHVSDFTYTDDPPLLYFNKMSYQIPYHLLHQTKHSFQTNDIVLSAAGANIRQAPSAAERSKVVTSVPNGEKEAVTILSPFVYDESYNYDTPEHPAEMQYKHYVWYKVKLHDGSVGYTASGELQSLGKRISGADRFETAVAISKQGWANGADTVVLARGYDFPDALAGTPLAYQLDAPLLLTRDQSLTATTKAEVQRLNAKKVILLGSSDAISQGVETELNGMGLTVSRIGGKDRFETAAQIADDLSNKGNTAILTFGFNFPDALTIAPYAAKMGYPIFLSRTAELPEATKNTLKNYDHTIVVGSEDVISDQIMKQLNDPVRYGGSNRFETNFTIVNHLFDGNNGQAYLATGYNFADALTGAVLAAKNNAPLLLNYSTRVPDPIKNAILTKKLHSFNFLGGSDVLGVENEIGALAQNIDY
ncbi:cell wall-binding repeat-containing protein [Bacillus sp. EB600]|uniref:cell wall-binding repeat-containing protein n=1 Tax=Bacillus sp. EB600 TaxID=2806345 RepID=UPI00210F05CA|nr:cell wall-binding repeat-containing protein [Bacillus sp. EB600]MCQ6278661.1 cell wall-binding repeat-containing protein [Bacillus sp. EB600]